MKIDRRRLLRGTLATPLVLTVRPASALAITSATACVKRCETIANERRPAKASASQRGDEWLRVGRDLSRIGPEPGKEFYPGKYFLGFDNQTYWRLDPHNPYRGNPQPTRYTRGSCYEQKTGEQVYLLALVDRHGNVVGFSGDSSRHGTPLMTSCYTSLIAMKQRA